MPPSAIRISARFNGPPGSANGGYTCGLVANALDACAAEVTLHAPPPLEVDLAVVREGVRIWLRHGETVVAEGRPAELELEPPAPVDRARAEAAARAGYERWAAAHPFPSCFVCGPKRKPGQGLRLFPGELDREGSFACPWQPHPSLADADGSVRREFVWAALDCPTSAPIANHGEGPPVVLGRLLASLDAPVRAAESHVIVSSALHRDGRKRSAVATLFDGDGRPLARSRALWIQLRQGR